MKENLEILILPPIFWRQVPLCVQKPKPSPSALALNTMLRIENILNKS